MIQIITLPVNTYVVLLFTFGVFCFVLFCFLETHQMVQFIGRPDTTKPKEQQQ